MNKKRKVLYYVQNYFLDCCLQSIQEIKDEVEVHLFIEISNDSKKGTIIEFDDIEKYPEIGDFKEIIKDDEYRKFIPFLSNIKSVKFIFFKTRSSFSPLNLLVNLKLARYIKENKIDIVHLDGLSARIGWILPFLFNKSLFLTIHDPIPHSGENHWKSNLIRKICSSFAEKIFFYSEFALKQFVQTNANPNKQLYSIKLSPYRFIATFITKELQPKGYILFFGRISYYKGIDILLEVIKYFDLSNPDQLFMVAGRFEDNSILTEEFENQKNVIIVNKHLEISELANIISNSKFVVCPYRDATQSGVLMTSFAMKKPVIATNVGAFAEYIEHDRNGLLTNPDPVDLAENIAYALKNGRYKYYEANLKNKSARSGLKKNSLIKGYRY